MSASTAILFAGGGTGGHIFPGLAIAECLHKSNPHIAISFLCSRRPGDAEMLRAERLAGEPVAFDPIPAQPFVLRPRGLVRFVGSWGGSVRRARELIRTAKANHGRVVVVAMGGFVAAPVVQAARVERCPVIMVNLDATPGRANRWIAKHASFVFTAARVPDSGWTLVPPIVRSAARAPGSAAHCRRTLGLDSDRPVLLVTGASLGAQTINRFMIAYSGECGQELRDGGWQVVHQSGKSDIEELRIAYKNARVDAVVEPFFREMGLAWGCAEMAISRAGAGSVAEAWCNQVPTVFLPYPFHADQHQKLNALPLETAGAAMLAEDLIEPRKNLSAVGPVLSGMLKDAQARARMRGALACLGPADGAERVAQTILTDA